LKVGPKLMARSPTANSQSGPEFAAANPFAPTANGHGNGPNPTSSPNPATSTGFSGNYILLDRVGPFSLLTPEDPPIVSVPVPEVIVPNTRLRIKYT
jgi:hypothetical protein